MAVTLAGIRMAGNIYMPRGDRTGQYGIRFTSAARKAKALRKLGVSADQIASVPQITPLLRDERRSLKPVLLAMHLSRDPVVRCFLAKRASLGVWSRQNTPWEAIAVAANIDPVYLLGATVLALRKLGKTIAMSQYPGPPTKTNRVRQAP
jgi:hypothetical protein